MIDNTHFTSRIYILLVSPPGDSLSLVSVGGRIAWSKPSEESTFYTHWLRDLTLNLLHVTIQSHSPQDHIASTPIGSWCRRSSRATLQGNHAEDEERRRWEDEEDSKRRLRGRKRAERPRREKQKLSIWSKSIGIDGILSPKYHKRSTPSQADPLAARGCEINPSECSRSTWSCHDRSATQSHRHTRGLCAGPLNAEEGRDGANDNGESTSYMRRSRGLILNPAMKRDSPYVTSQTYSYAPPSYLYYSTLFHICCDNVFFSPECDSCGYRCSNALSLKVRTFRK